jgi:transposase-like protein
MELENDLARPTDHDGLRLPSEVPAPADPHMTILQTLFNLQAADTPLRLGPAGQQPRRQLEQLVRLRAVEFTRQLTDLGYRHCEAARRLGVNQRTLRHWTGELTPSLRGPASLVLPPALGRPLTQSDAAQQQAVISVLDTVGPGLGVPTLRRHFDGMARAEIDALLKQYRRCWRAANPRLLHVLTWRKPGSVWAADFAEAPCLIDGHYRYLLAVRDLASGQQLLWQPVADLTADTLLAELPLLFALHGTPWILKTDNGSAFIADVLRWYLQRWGVRQLFSPPLTPAYNGSIEASIGSLKKRTQRQSDLAGHPGHWTTADIDAARIEANTTARPRRLHGRTPQHVWDSRLPLDMDHRERFETTVELRQTEARLELGLAIDEPLTRAEQAAVDRVALSRALVAHDLLLFRRRRIPPRITRPKVAIIP